jgi:hypothetical protein
VLESGGPLCEGEVAHDALDVREAIVVIQLDAAEQRLGETPEHAILAAFEDHVELEIVFLLGLEGSGGDRIGMRDRAALLPALLVEVRDVPDLVAVLHLAREQAVVAPQRDVLARLVGGELRAVARHHPEEREAAGEPVPLDDPSRFELCHVIPRIT